MPLRVETLTGPALRRQLPALARLRATVFREWPYLYAVDDEYEARYLEAYAASAGAGLVLAFDGEEAVGASTCLPLADETANVQAPFLARGLDVERFYYFGESVLLPRYRGRGVGIAFFQHREAHARASGVADVACFCAVERAANHAKRPDGAQSLEPFWVKRGYAKRPDLVCEMSWREVGETEETAKRMVFWTKSLPTTVPS